MDILAFCYYLMNETSPDFWDFEELKYTGMSLSESFESN